MVDRNVILWCGDAPNHRALANKLHKHVRLSAIVIDQKKKANKKVKPFLLLRIWDLIRFKEIYSAWKKMQRLYNKEFPEWPDVPIYRTPSINNQEAYNFTNGFKPQLIVVSGTGIVRDLMLSTPVAIGIVNLHTGLSPYVKGGPNCTNWCIANNQWHLVGNTIMWINSGIDSGNIIVNETVDIRSCGSLAEAQQKVMEHAHGLYLSAVDYLLKSQAPYISVPQSDLGQGSLYLTRMWSARMKSRLLRNWKNRHKAVVTSIPQTVSLKSRLN